RKVGGQSAALRDSGQTADAFAGEEDGEIERFGDQLSQPVERRLRIGQIEDAEHRATNGRRTLALEERCQFLKLTRFGQRDCAACKRQWHEALHKEGRRRKEEGRRYLVARFSVTEYSVLSTGYVLSIKYVPSIEYQLLSREY